MFNVVFYETDKGKKPVEEFLNSLDVKMRAKIVSMMELLEEKGNQLREPYSKHLDDGIFELRAIQGNNTTRMLYFFYVGKTIVITNGFIKKQQKTPQKEIDLAKERRTDFLKRIKGDKYNENTKTI